jgi:putative multicomponent Na+:H+ antiporter subunit B
MSIIFGLLLKIPSQWSLLVLALISLAIWNTCWGTCWHTVPVEEMMDDSYIYAIVALLPLAAVMLTVQVNPYNALVIRGILGAIAALVYAVLGAADVALTEALVGTMLAITLYAVAVRSSLVMRIGVLKDELSQTNDSTSFHPTDR